MVKVRSCLSSGPTGSAFADSVDSTILETVKCGCLSELESVKMSRRFCLSVFAAAFATWLGCGILGCDSSAMSTGTDSAVFDVTTPELSCFVADMEWTQFHVSAVGSFCRDIASCTSEWWIHPNDSSVSYTIKGTSGLASLTPAESASIREILDDPEFKRSLLEGFNCPYKPTDVSAQFQMWFIDDLSISRDVTGCLFGKGRYQDSVPLALYKQVSVIGTE